MTHEELVAQVQSVARLSSEQHAKFAAVLLKLEPRTIEHGLTRETTEAHRSYAELLGALATAAHNGLQVKQAQDKLSEGMWTTCLHRDEAEALACGLITLLASRPRPMPAVDAFLQSIVQSIQNYLNT